MAFYRYLKTSLVVDIKATEKEDALRELARALCKAQNIKNPRTLIEDILKREEASSTFIGMGVAIPQAKGNIADDFAIIVGRSRPGIEYDAARNALAHIVVLVMCRKELDDSEEQIDLLNEVASFFKDDLIRQELLEDDDVSDVMSLIGSYKSREKAAHGKKKTSDPVIDAAMDMAKDLKAGSIVLLADAVRENEFLDSIKANRSTMDVIVITSNKSRFEEDDKRFDHLIFAPAFPSSRTGQIKIGILLGISRNILKKTDKVICVSGSAKTGMFDTVIAMDIEKEYEFFFTATRTILPPDVEAEVLERVLGLASEIAVEGREGKPRGTIFIVGDTNTVNQYVRQLIINPFRGYSEAERNILDPGLDETIKEFAGIDGAFIVTGDGIVVSAGSYLRPPSEIDEEIGALPSGFGTRHAAAAGLTLCSNALAIVVSESTGMVSIFKNGALMLSLAKPGPRGGWVY